MYLNTINKTIKAVALMALVTTAATSVNAKEMKFLPILTDKDYCFSPSVAILGGSGKYKDSKDYSSMYGVELSIACPMLQLESLDIKQQISLVRSYKNNGFSTNNLEFNPHVMFNVMDKLQVGAGPGVGIIAADVNGKTDTVIGLNIGASLSYEVTNSMFIGAETRYQWTTDANFGGGNVSLNNYRTLLKVGYHF